MKLLLSVSCVDQTEKQFYSENFELIKLSEGVYSCVHKFGGTAICNAGIIDNGRETIIFDAFLSPDVSEELVELVNYLELSPIKYVINSHGHNDHIRGNQSFANDIDIIATKRTKEKIAREEPESILAEKGYANKRYQYFHKEIKEFKGDTTSRGYMELKMMEPYFKELSLSHKKIKTRLPNILINDKKEIRGPKRDIILMEFDSCHTESDLVMYLPKEKILFSGDIVFNKFHPYLADGNYINLKKSLVDLKEMDIDSIVPGHGNIGGKEILANMINYVQDLEDKIESMIDTNGNLDDLRSKPMLSQYKDWWLGSFYLSNLEHIYFDKVKK